MQSASFSACFCVFQYSSSSITSCWSIYVSVCMHLYMSVPYSLYLSVTWAPLLTVLRISSDVQHSNCRPSSGLPVCCSLAFPLFLLASNLLQFPCFSCFPSLFFLYSLLICTVKGFTLSLHLMHDDDDDDQSLKLALRQRWVWSVSDFIFLATPYEVGCPVLSLTVSSSHW